jgi:hypothetical protein
MIQPAITEVADTPRTRCAFYRRECRFPAQVKSESGQITVKVGAIAAITMPGELGARVKGALRARGIAPGPVIAHPRARRWTFLADPDIPFDDILLHAEMYRASVTVAPAGAEVALPSPADPTGTHRVWNELPHGTDRPSAAALLDVIRDCAGMKRSGR